MENVSVVCLIFKSVNYMDFIAKSFKRHTEGRSLWFVGNNATQDVVNHAKEMQYNYIDFRTPYEQMPYPGNIGDIYRAWNFAGNNIQGDAIVFVNSDMAFSRDWLDNLLMWKKSNTIVCSRLVESGKMPSGEHAISKNFGRSYRDFDEASFEIFAETIKKTETHHGGLFMPLLIDRNIFITSGGYPEGNVNGMSGDKVFFEKLALMGIEHITAFNSIVYHIQEGEVSE